MKRIWKNKYLFSAVVTLSLALIIYLGSLNGVLPAGAGTAGKKPIYFVETEENRKAVALSFDAAWGADETQKIIDTFAEYGLHTTFFVVKFWVEDYPEMAKAIVDSGNELQNHSATHPHLNSLSSDQIKKEVMDTHQVILDTTGFTPNLFRPPFGEYNDRVITTLEEMGYFPIQWSKDSLDWKDLSAGEIEQRIMKDLKSGDIILFHNNGKHTVEAIQNIIPKILEQGYEIVPVGELIYHENYTINSTTGGQKKDGEIKTTEESETVPSDKVSVILNK